MWVTGLLAIIIKPKRSMGLGIIYEVWGLDKNRLWATVYNDDEKHFSFGLK
ncbi:MAG: hypothetical protein Ct9H300mP29_3370 [Candidatus Neomarinimicrobiota bacterium]|nr:MAG: hypothetical protein Ct9H300mP29_3370 [Candidatus Neomarinimicrobiota bacterium]